MAFSSGGGSSWAELERRLSGREAPPPDGRDSPVSRAARDGYVPPPDLWERRGDDNPGQPRVPYAELHAHSNFSFLDGASDPEELVEEAARLGLDAVAITDHDGLYGVVRAAEAARELGVRLVVGAELGLDRPGERAGPTDPGGQHLLVLARGTEGYARLCRVISAAHLRGGEKGRPVYDRDEVATELAGHVQVLTGCRRGAVRQALEAGGPDAARSALRELVAVFGGEHVAVELTNEGTARCSTRNDALSALAGELGLPVVATTAAHYHRPERAPLGQVVSAIRARRSLDEMEGWLRASGMAHLRSGTEMQQWFGRWPGAVQNAALLGVRLALDLQLIAPDLPPAEVPDGHTPQSWLRHLTLEGAAERYGPPASNPDAYAQLEHELAVIADLGFAGYFLIVWEIVAFCRRCDIYVQGRGSAANSAVCYALGITNCDPVEWHLLFERFLSSERDTYPDIDLDIEADRREEVIQHVYTRYGRTRAAQVANVITYRARSAVRDAARALGHSPGSIDALAKLVDPWGPPLDSGDDTPGPAAAAPSAGGDGQSIPPQVLAVAGALEGAPRHLGIHSGGMVLCDRPVSEVCPVEHARMDNRTVLQWDKDDCAAAGLVKIDLLGLGMLSAIHYTVDLIEQAHGVRVDLAHLPLDDEAVWDMICAADTVGVFQIESRAQMATLPRLRPRTMWDLAVEVALIRPGPIQGGAVHPYLRRRGGEPWQHLHPNMANALDRTLGVILFQEQVMQLAIDVAGFTAAEADALRRAMGSKRSGRKMALLRQRFLDGAARNGLVGRDAQVLFGQMAAFADYGFPQSHALSFAHLVFASAFLKCHYPAAFCAGLLRAQPMGFYSPQSLVADARRHGVRVRGVDLNCSDVHASLEPDPDSAGGQAVRLGLAGVRGLGTQPATRITTARQSGGPFRDVTELAERVELDKPQLEALATAGALPHRGGGSRRAALWEAGAAARHRAGMLPGTSTATPPPALPGMTRWELLAADVWATGISPDQHPVQLLRAHLDQLGALPTARLRDTGHGTRVLVGGAITHRQRPPTAGGITFLNIEDESGMANVVVSAGLRRRHTALLRNASALLVRGIVENAHGATNLVADRLEPLQLGDLASPSRDYR
ncbi:error-prone DNA polymerase [Prauserella muralis]|uniref:Error-prone DNA polymerase n=1 Tax=Prauserella muralis TaxID=588067 RepID=A0A2V4ACG9_9PSEU|nr:error-prone DNA polymerase [Prauserella muralis]TWE11171.1 error-prone DNA polymerase [Prauserella muralis]